jgi:hypothetical protein
MVMPIVHVFSEINVGKYKDVKHYELIDVKCGTTQLSNQINISKNRSFANSNPDYWLKIKEGKKWSKCITGLFKTSKMLTYKGDKDYKGHLIIFIFSDNAKIVTVYFFKNYYTKDLSKVLSLINS